MKPCSTDLRDKVLAAYVRKQGSQRPLATRFAIAPATVQNWLRRRRETGAAAPRTAPGGTPKLDAEAQATLREWAGALCERTGVRLHEATVRRYARRLVFLDESGVNLSMARRYAWSARGTPACGDVPVDRGTNQTLVAAVRLDGGPIAPMQTDTGTTGGVFTAYVAQVLVPALRPGDGVPMDNLSSHKVSGVEARIEAAGASVLFLPR